MTESHPEPSVPQESSGAAPPPPPAYQPPPPPPPMAPPAMPPMPPMQSGPAYGQPPYPPQPGFAPPGAYPTRMTPSDVRLWAGAAHWSAFVLGFIGPLVIMLTKGNEDPFVRRQAVESLNFQITCGIAEVVSAILIFVLVGILLLPLVILFHLIFVIVAAVKVSQGEDYRYPINVRLVS